MTNKILPPPLYLAFLIIIFLSGCCMNQELPLYYHTLNNPEQTASDSTTAKLPLILVGPIRIASFLDQGHLVKQRTDTSVSLIEQHRWAGNLSEMLSNTLIGQLTQSLVSEEIYSFPITNSVNGLRVEIDILHFEQDLDMMATIAARWRILSLSDQTILHAATSHSRVALDKKDYDGLVEGLSQGFFQLSQEISSKILLLTTTRKRSY